jgi:hypothetical protein
VNALLLVLSDFSTSTTDEGSCTTSLRLSYRGRMPQFYATAIQVELLFSVSASVFPPVSASDTCSSRIFYEHMSALNIMKALATLSWALNKKSSKCVPYSRLRR